MLKAAREAKTNSSWLNPNGEYEEALTQFIEKVLGSAQFLDDFRKFQMKASHFGMFNSLSQTLLKITSPGVPDFYQGTELWTFTLVDPDNRAPVDYGLRTKLLDEINAMESSMERGAIADELLRTKEDGRIKLYVTYKALNFRRENRELYSGGEYVPLHVSGKHAERVIAFGYFSPDAAAITAVPRLIAGLAGRRLHTPPPREGRLGL
jgi:(1->4)-alpha-D-glucan 1-alpha-D-glucosylmutase